MQLADVVPVDVDHVPPGGPVPAGMSWGMMSSMRPVACSPLASTTATRLSRRNFAANSAASITWPFCCSPSPITTNTRKGRPHIREASARPHPTDSPWPRLPLHHSTPRRPECG